MKKFFMACSLILSLCCLEGCSNDNEPSSSKVNGKIEIDGKKVNLKYGYKFEYEDDVDDDDPQTSYVFYDIDMLKYIDENGDITKMPDTEWSGLGIICIGHESNYIYPIAIYVSFNINSYTETYLSYEEAHVEDTFNDYGSFSIKNGNVKCSAKSLPMDKWDADDVYQGVSSVSFSIEGKPQDLTGLFDEEDYYSRGVVITEITDPKQIKALKSFMPSHHRTAK